MLTNMEQNYTIVQFQKISYLNTSNFGKKHPNIPFPDYDTAVNDYDFFSKTDKIHSNRGSTSSSYHQRNETVQMLMKDIKSNVRFSNSCSQSPPPSSNSSYSNSSQQRKETGQVLTKDIKSDVRFSNSRSQSPPPSSNSSYSNSSQPDKQSLKSLVSIKSHSVASQPDEQSKKSSSSKKILHS